MLAGSAVKPSPAMAHSPAESGVVHPDRDIRLVAVLREPHCAGKLREHCLVANEPSGRG
jgi:hypothetical protein